MRFLVCVFSLLFISISLAQNKGSISQPQMLNDGWTSASVESAKLSAAANRILRHMPFLLESELKNTKRIGPA